MTETQRFRLKDIFLGLNDGKKEALYKEDFERFFFDYQNMYEQAVSKEKFLILGRKGSGKTILAEYVRKRAESDPCHFCEIRSYKDFRFHELMQLKSRDIPPNEYICIWEWVILLDLARLTLQDNGIENSNLRAKLDKFYRDNYYSLNIDSKKVIEITKANKINGSVLKAGAEHAQTTTIETGAYHHYLEDLREVVLGLLASSKSQYTLFYDDLDDRFRDDPTYRNNIISLLKAADKLNLSLLERKINAKAALLLRSDIFAILNDPDLNKIKMVNGLIIDWGNVASDQSPLFDLVITKTKASIPDLNGMERGKIFNLLFPQDIRYIHPARFLLERTFFRPRDVVTYLNLIIQKHPSTEYFGWKGFVEVKKAYSEYFFQEVRNELSGHLDDEEIDKGTLLLKQFNRYHFPYKDISTYFEENKLNYNNLDLDKLLRVFFRFSVIGNKWFNEYKNKDYYSWAYRDNKAELDLNKGLVVHLGLREELSL